MSNGKEYYGGFFWLAVVSFIVPLFVGYKAFEKVSPTTKPVPRPDVSGVCNEVWDYLLKTYVENGLVDYDGMKKDYLFSEYLRELGGAKPELLPTDNHRLALMCNAYNALVINGVITHKKPPKVNEFAVDGTAFFNLKEHIFAGQTISLNDLENGMIRPTFKEPRIHVALVCAARSCPAIRAEAYTGDRVIEQLQDQSKQFANNETYVRFDEGKNELEVSPILNWYGDDWNERYPDGGWQRWLTQLVDSAELKTNIEKAIRGEGVGISFATYDWALNSQSKPGESVGGGNAGGFGSGSIPEE